LGWDGLRGRCGEGAGKNSPPAQDSSVHEEITCHLFIYAAPGATPRNRNEKSKSSTNVTTYWVTNAKRYGNAETLPKKGVDWERRSQPTTPLLQASLTNNKSGKVV